MTVPAAYGLVGAAGCPFAVPTLRGGRNPNLINAATIRARIAGGTVRVRF